MWPCEGNARRRWYGAPPETTPAITVKRPGEPEAQKAVKVAARAAQAVAATALAQAAAVLVAEALSGRPP